MSNKAENALEALTSLASTSVRVISSAGVSAKATIANVAKYIIETYASSSLAGSNQSVKSAIDSLNSNCAYDTGIKYGNSYDCNNFKSGCTLVNNATLNNPFNSHAYVITFIASGNYRCQIAFRYVYSSSEPPRYRTYVDGGWNSWTEMA